jgi:hypothetical protein
LLLRHDAVELADQDVVGVLFFEIVDRLTRLGRLPPGDQRAGQGEPRCLVLRIELHRLTRRRNCKFRLALGQVCLGEVAMSQSGSRRDVDQILEGRDRRTRVAERKLGPAEDVEEHGVARSLLHDVPNQVKSRFVLALGEPVQRQRSSCEGVVRVRLKTLDQIRFRFVRMPGPAFERGEIAIGLRALWVVLENIEVVLPRLVHLAIGQREFCQITVGVDVGAEDFMRLQERSPCGFAITFDQIDRGLHVEAGRVVRLVLRRLLGHSESLVEFTCTKIGQKQRRLRAQDLRIGLDRLFECIDAGVRVAECDIGPAEFVQ